MPLGVRYAVRVFSVPRRALGDVKCEVVPTCPPCDPNETPEPSTIYIESPTSGYQLYAGPACVTSTIFVASFFGSTSEECTFDPDVVPRWWLQDVVDQYGPICATFGGQACIYANTARHVLTNMNYPGDDPGDCSINPLHCSGWDDIRRLWAAVGEQATLHHCGLGPTPEFPLIGMKYRVSILKMPPGSYEVDSYCVERDSTEPCPCPEEPPN